MTIGENIKKIRKLKKLTQKQVGEACNPKMAESTIRQYELGKRNPKPATAKKIANALNVPLYILYKGVENVDFTDPIIESDRDVAYTRFETELFGLILKKQENIELPNYTKETLDSHIDAYIEHEKLNIYFSVLVAY